MKLQLWGALTTDDVADVSDDSVALKAAALSLETALGDIASAAWSASLTWSWLPEVLVSDAVTPALAPLMEPAKTLASRLHDASEQFVRAVSAAAAELADLTRSHDSLVRQIDEFHGSAAAKAEAHIAEAMQDGVVATVRAEVLSWKQIPALLYGEGALRLKVSVHNARVESTLSSLAAQIAAIDVAKVRLPDIRGPHAAAELLSEGLAPSAVAALTGGSLAALLAGMSEGELEEALRNNKELAAWVKGLSPADARSWWDSLGKRQRAGVIAAIPAVIGSLTGIPYAARSEANMTTVKRTMALLAAKGRKDCEEYKALKAISDTMSKGTKKNPRQLISLTLGKKPLAAISYGDLDTADIVTWMVPGMGTNVAGNIGAYVGAAKNLAYEQRSVDDDANTAVVAWLDYKAPGAHDFVHEASNEYALAGGQRLADAIKGLEATRATTGAVPRVSVVAHSYGTLVAAVALTKVHADSVLFEGSPGIPELIAPSAAALNVPSGQVFATQAIHDGLAPFGQNAADVNPYDSRTDPTADSWGAHDLSSEADGDLRAVTTHGPLVHGTHNPDSYSYWDFQTTTLRNAARVTTGSGESIAEWGNPEERAAANVPSPVPGPSPSPSPGVPLGTGLLQPSIG